MSLHLEDKGSLFFFIDRIRLVIVLKRIFKQGRGDNWNLYSDLIILSFNSSKNLFGGYIGAEHVKTIIITEKGENCLQYPKVTYHSEF